MTVSPVHACEMPLESRKEELVNNTRTPLVCNHHEEIGLVYMKMKHGQILAREVKQGHNDTRHSGIGYIVRHCVTVR